MGNSIKSGFKSAGKVVDKPFSRVRKTDFYQRNSPIRAASAAFGKGDGPGARQRFGSVLERERYAFGDRVTAVGQKATSKKVITTKNFIIALIVVAVIGIIIRFTRKEDDDGKKKMSPFLWIFIGPAIAFGAYFLLITIGPALIGTKKRNSLFGRLKKR